MSGILPLYQILIVIVISQVNALMFALSDYVYVDSVHCNEVVVALNVEHSVH